MSNLVPLSFYKIMRGRLYTGIVLGTAHKQFAIYTDPSVGQNIQSFLTDKKKARPDTHTLLHQILTDFSIKPLQIVIENLEDTLYFARLFLEKQEGDIKKILEIDARPSDCIMLALMNKIPILCKKEIFEAVTPYEGID